MSQHTLPTREQIAQWIHEAGADGAYPEYPQLKRLIEIAYAAGREPLQALLGEALPLVQIALWNDLARRIIASIPPERAAPGGSSPE
jgi:hypothetical protein